MELKTAIKLIESGIPKTGTPQVWADLGAGSGLFTRALSELIKPGSIIHAIDKDTNALAQIDVPNVVEIVKITNDFTKYSPGAETFDGILIANALHYVREPHVFLRSLRKSLKANGRIIVVEYERSQPNQWVPYPIPFLDLQKLALECGFGSVTKTGEAPSAYHAGGMYSALILS